MIGRTEYLNWPRKRFGCGIGTTRDHRFPFTRAKEGFGDGTRQRGCLIFLTRRRTSSRTEDNRRSPSLKDVDSHPRNRNCVDVLSGIAVFPRLSETD
jgi:hypothetical protein